MATKLSSSGPLSISSLTALNAVIQPTFFLNLTALAWNDFTPVLFYSLSSINQGLSGYLNNGLANPGTFTTGYGAINLTNYSLSNRLSVTNNTILNNPIQFTITTCNLDQQVSIYTNIDGASASPANHSYLSGYNIATIMDAGSFGSITTDTNPDPGGAHTRGPIKSIFTLSSIGAKIGSYVDFYIGAGPQTAPNGRYYGYTNVSVKYLPVLSTISPPTLFSYYRHQDFDIPSAPLNLSNFLDATNYDLSTTNYFYISANKFGTNYFPTTAYYIYQADGSTKLYTNLVTKLSALSSSSNYKLTTKHNPISGILITSNTIATFLNTSQQFDLLVNVNGVLFNGYPLCNLVSIPVGSTNLSLSAYMFSLSSYCNLYVRPSNITSNTSFSIEIINYPILIYPNNLL